MPKVEFYVIERGDRLLTACHLIAESYANKHRIYVHTQDQPQAHDIDEKLWTYQEDSFLPHNLMGEGPNPPPPIQIGFDCVPHKHNDTLINLHQTVPEFYQQFAHIIEIVDTASQDICREHFRFYRTKGLTITTHKPKNTLGASNG